MMAFNPPLHLVRLLPFVASRDSDDTVTTFLIPGGLTSSLTHVFNNVNWFSNLAVVFSTFQVANLGWI